MRKLLLLALISFPSFLFGQQYDVGIVQSRSDSILKSRIGEELFAYTQFDSTTYYEYKNFMGKTYWETLGKTPVTKGKFRKVKMGYSFSAPISQCPGTDVVSGKTTLILDRDLKLILEPKLEFSQTGKSECTLLNRQQALEAAKADGLQKGIESPTATIVYDKAAQTFTWRVQNLVSRTQTYNSIASGKIELVYIDAVTGEIKSHETKSFGPSD